MMTMKLGSLALIALCIHACTASGGGPADVSTGALGGASTFESSGGAGTESSFGGSPDKGFAAAGAAGRGAPEGAAGASTTLLYAHTNTTLFKLDPSSVGAGSIRVGDFDCIGSGAGRDTSMTDIAVDQEERLFGISSHFVYALTPQGGGVHCGPPVALSASAGASAKFYALTFAPAGVIDAQKETLVAGNTAGELWAIDQNGNLEQHGVLGVVPQDDGRGHTYKNAGLAWELSGDLVFLANGGAPIGFATVRDCPNPPSVTGCDASDTLLEIDLAKLATPGSASVAKAVRGKVVKRQGCNDGTKSEYGAMYGIAALHDKIYGFSHSGAIVEIRNDDATACVVSSSSDSWSGAGVTTIAPVDAPPVIK